ncbi:Protein of unknown function [Cotesia congregata]|uniref:Uncharacterized protein n=1 Tax=Cotesia congregata TaxID=51543 RepID=A0A8J2HBE7_COTCN|nr:Protein of unknown function [Cotesia congregata]
METKLMRQKSSELWSVEMCRHTYNTYIYMYIYLFGKFSHVIFCSEAKRRPVITCDLRHFLLYCARYVIYYYTFSLLVKILHPPFGHYCMGIK